MKPFLITICLWLLGVLAYAQPLVLNNPDHVYDIAEHCAALPVQPGQKITIDSLLLHPEKYPFRPLDRKALQPNDKRMYWLKVDLANPTPDNYFLRFLFMGDMLYQGFETDKNQLIKRWKVNFNGVNTENLFQRSRGIIPLLIRQGQTHTLFVLVHRNGIPTLHAGVMSSQKLAEDTHYQDLFQGIGFGFFLIIAIYSLFLGIRLKDRDNVLYAFIVIISLLNSAQNYGVSLEFPGTWPITLKHNYGVILGIGNSIALFFAISFLQIRQRARWLYWPGVVLSVLFAAGSLSILCIYLTGLPDQKLQFYFAMLVAFTAPLYRVIAGITVSIKRYVPALFFCFGQLFIYVFIIVFTLGHNGFIPFTFWVRNSLFIGFISETIIYLLGLTYKINQLKKKQDEAILEQLRLTEQNQTLIETQNRVLEEKVEQRTAELKASQAQLIQKEKLASLGELTAGIAHEIQNPLNFVNNFAEVSAELTGELKDELTRGDLDEAGFIADDLAQNLTKIAHHGRRASAIVRGMLEHSRMESGDRQTTNLNTLADDYLRLAYQGQRAKDNTFNCRLITAFDPALPPVNVVAQDIGRVLLNLCQNAFYAVQQRATQAGEGDEPTVWVRTRRQNDHIELRVQDNGTGIPDAIRTKIFQPFFTTKPAGEGTGLGLSLSYDIITKGHGGTMTVESQQGEGTAFNPFRNRAVTQNY